MGKVTLETEMKKISQQLQKCDDKIEKLHEKLRCQFVPLENQAEGEDCDKKERINKLAEVLTIEQEKKHSHKTKQTSRKGLPVVIRLKPVDVKSRSQSKVDLSRKSISVESRSQSKVNLS